MEARRSSADTAFFQFIESSTKMTRTTRVNIKPVLTSSPRLFLCIFCSRRHIQGNSALPFDKAVETYNHAMLALGTVLAVGTVFAAGVVK